MPQPLPSRKLPAMVISRRQERGSPQHRGYTARWNRLSAEYRRRNPFCAWCEQNGRVTFARLVDHKIPIADGGEMFDPANWWGLCISHHGRKSEMEKAAREGDQIAILPLWCDDPNSRPVRFR